MEEYYVSFRDSEAVSVQEWNPIRYSAIGKAGTKLGIKQVFASIEHPQTKMGR